MTDRLDRNTGNRTLQDFRSDEVQPWAGSHLPYVMALRDEFIALKTALMQTVQDATH